MYRTQCFQGIFGKVCSFQVQIRHVGFELIVGKFVHPLCTSMFVSFSRDTNETFLEPTYSNKRDNRQFRAHLGVTCEKLAQQMLLHFVGP